MSQPDAPVETPPDAPADAPAEISAANDVVAHHARGSTSRS